MPINMTDLFTALGKCGVLATNLRSTQAAMSADIEDIRTELNSQVLTQPLTNFDSTKATALATAGDWMRFISPLATSIIISTVYADAPSQAYTLDTACLEIIRQMVDAGDSVKEMTVSSSIVDGSNDGDGKMYVTSTRFDGSSYGWQFNETSVRIACTSDSQTGGQTEGRELFTYIGQPISFTGSFSPWTNDFPLGSGTTASIRAIQPSTGSLMGSDGMFKTYSATTPFGPTGWTVIAGTSGAQFAPEATTTYNGTQCLKLMASGTLFSMKRRPDNTLSPDSQYFLGVRLRASASLTGVLRISVIDDAGVVVTGGDGSPMRIDVNLSTVSTSAFGSHGGWFKTPRSVPGLSIKVEVQTAISGGNLYVDWLTLSEPTILYTGSPLVAIISGVDKFVKDDYFELTTTNNYGGASNLATWLWFWDRILQFQPRASGWYLPTSATPTISDSLLV